MNAADVIAEVLEFHTPEADGICGGYRCGGCDWDGADELHVHNGHIAAVTLDALKAAGYAVVELPKRCAVPSGWDEGCTGAWPCDVKGVADPISTWPEPGREIATSDGDFCSIAEARAFAVALLAAASHPLNGSRSDRSHSWGGCHGHWRHLRSPLQLAPWWRRGTGTDYSRRIHLRMHGRRSGGNHPDRLTAT